MDALRVKQRTRKCAICRTPFVPRSMTHKACSTPCAAAVAVKDREKRERKELRARKEKLKTRSDWIKEAQIAFNSYIRARDRDRPCISCGVVLGDSTIGGASDCGHYRSVGSAPHLRFDPSNAHAQCKKCNRYLGGRAVDYRVGLLERIGLADVERLESDQSTKKWTIEELKAIRDHYRAKLKAIKKE